MKLERQTVKKTVFWVALAVILLYAMSAGLADAQYQWLQAPGWSRAKLIGQTALREPAPLAVDNEGHSYILIFPREGSALTATILSLDTQGNERWHHVVSENLTAPTQPKLIWHDEHLTIMWLDEETIYQTRLDRNGQLLEAPQPLSFPNPIATYNALATNSGLQVWAGGPKSEPGIYAQNNGSPPELVDPNGLSPVLQVDENGFLHAIWLRQLSTPAVSVVYGGSSAEDNWLSEAIEIEQLQAGASTRLRGPWFSLEEGQGYLAWTADLLSGMGAGQSLSQYVSFPLVRETAVSPRTDFQFPYGRQQVYAQTAGELQTGNRIPFAGAQGRQTSPLEGYALVSSQAATQEGVIALRVSVAYLKQKEVSQIALYYLDNGANNGYQLLSFSANGSIQPSLMQNPDGDLAASWLEQGQTSGFSVYLAGTSPQLHDSFARLTLQDYGLFILQTVFGLLQSATFTPFSLIIWSAAPLLILIVTHWFRPDKQTWQHPAFIIPLATAVLVYWYAKYFTLRSALWYVPFSAWIPVIPDWLNLPLQIFTPLTITLLAAYTAWHFSYKRNYESIYLLFIIYAIIDAVLSMSIYGGVLYNAI